MGAVQVWLTALMGVALVVAATLLCRARSLPRPPLRLALLALAVWALLAVLPLQLLPAPYPVWVGVSDDLLLALAAVRLLVWAGLELPGGLGWWPAPPQLLVQMLSLGGWALTAVLVVRQTAKFDLINLVATSAVLTAVIGLASQEGLKDLFSGLELQLAEDFRIGDWLELGDGRRGIVEALSWRETRLRTLEGGLMVVPNSKITADIFINRSRFEACSDRFEVGLDYDFPPGRALPLLLELVQRHPLVLEEPAPRVRIKAFLDSAISYEVHVWQRAAGDRAMLELRSDLLAQIWYAVHRRGQSFPFPVREIRPRRSALPQDHHSQATGEDCRRALAAVPMFAGLDEEQLQLLIQDGQLLTFGPGESVVREGEEGESLYCLLRGRVDVCKRAEEGRSVRVRQLQAGEVFGEMTLFLDAPRSATVRTVGECLLLRVGREAVSQLLRQNPALLERMASLVSARQAELEMVSQEAEDGRPNSLLDRMRQLFLAVRGS